MTRVCFLTPKRVPIYAAASWASLMSQSAAFYLDPIRDIYEVCRSKPLSNSAELVT